MNRYGSTLIAGLAIVCASSAWCGGGELGRKSAPAITVDVAAEALDSITVIAPASDVVPEDSPPRTLLDGPGACDAVVIYDNTTSEGSWYHPGPAYELLDFATSDGGTVTSFTFGYVTTDSDPGTVTVQFYSGTDSSTCTGTFLKGWDFSGMSGLPDGGAYAFSATYDIPEEDQFALPSGAFGYSYQFSNANTGCWLAGGGTGNEDCFWKNCSLSWFGGSPYASFYMKISAATTGEIHGCKWYDVDGEGDRDPGDPGLAGWTIYIDENCDGDWDPGEPEEVTDGSGNYAFTDLPAGTYVIGEKPQNCWTQTFPGEHGEVHAEARRSTPSLEDLERMIIDSPPTPPPGIIRAAADLSSESAVMLSEVPTSTWTYGCSATAAGMIFGYYDRQGYPDMYTGPANGGLAPLTDLGQGIGSPIPGSCSIIATQNGFDGRITNGHVDDYWISTDSPGPDPWEGNWTEHTWADCTADFMGTNQWKWDFEPWAAPNGMRDANADGGTSLVMNVGSGKLYDYIPPADKGLPQTMLCHGLRLFAESRGYTVQENYTQKVDAASPGGFSFADYMAEIDAGRPVMIQVEGHSMAGVGYDAPDTVYLHDTWDNHAHSMTWGTSYAGMAHEAMTVIHLASPAIPGTHTVTLIAGQIVEDIDFGNTCCLDPDPMTWAQHPQQTGTDSIVMEAAALLCCLPPYEYEFDFIDSPTGGPGGTDSGWQADTSYLDTGLGANHQYRYRCRGADDAGKTVGWSAVSSKYTLPVQPDVICDRAKTTPYDPGTVFTFTNNAGWGSGSMDHYHYVFDNDPGTIPTGTSPVWSSGALPQAPSPGSWWLHVMSHNPEDASGGVKHDGPYVVRQWTLTVQSTPITGVNITGDKPGTTDYPATCDDQEVVNLTAPPTVTVGLLHYDFVEWTGDGMAAGLDVQVTMDTDKTVVAEYLLRQHTLTVQSTPITGVDITGDKPGTTDYPATCDDQEVVNLTAPPTVTVGLLHYDFVEWTGDGIPAGQDIQVLMDDDKTVTAEYALRQHTLTVQSSVRDCGITGVVITGDKPGQTGYAVTCDHNEVVYLEAPLSPVVEDVELRFACWILDDVDQPLCQRNIEITMDADHTAEARYRLFADLNGDCTVSVLDLIAVRNHLYDDVATNDNCLCDLNGDGQISILDLIAVRNHLYTVCPCPEP